VTVVVFAHKSTGNRSSRSGSAQTSIALSAIAGGMYEIGDDSLLLSGEKDRLALVENRDLLNMAKAGRASTPVDLMAYEPEDGQPSVFLLRQSPRQSILTVFNWTDEPRSHSLSLADLGVPVSFPSGHSGLPADSAYPPFRRPLLRSPKEVGKSEKCFEPASLQVGENGETIQIGAVGIQRRL